MQTKAIATLPTSTALALLLAADARAQFTEQWEGEELPPWENPQVVEINRLPAHATLVPFSDVEGALRGDRASSPWVRSLNGTWRFHFAANASEAPDGFWREDADTSGWGAHEANP